MSVKSSFFIPIKTRKRIGSTRWSKSPTSIKCDNQTDKNHNADLSNRRRQLDY